MADTTGRVMSDTQKAVLTVLRIAIGWHFLYEGVAKLLTPGWSAAPYLQTSTWIFSDFFRWIAATPWALKATDLFNVWGLTLIGLGLMLGVFTRLVSLFGIALLAMYYLAHPPLLGSDWRLPSEGHYFVVNKNLVELLALSLFAAFPTRALAGLDRLFAGLLGKSKLDEAPDARRLSRRELVGNLAAVPVLGAFAYGAYKKQKFEKVHAITGATITLQEAALKDLKGELPVGAVGNLRMTRLILGCNLIGGWAHSRADPRWRAGPHAWNSRRRRPHGRRQRRVGDTNWTDNSRKTTDSTSQEMTLRGQNPSRTMPNGAPSGATATAPG